MLAAMKNENPEIITTLINSGADVNVSNETFYGLVSFSGWTALIYATSSNENPEIITTLLKSGADINLYDDNNMTALMTAARSNKNLEVLTALLENGADATLKCNEGKTAFDYAQENENLKNTQVYQQLKQACSE